MFQNFISYLFEKLLLFTVGDTIYYKVFKDNKLNWSCFEGACVVNLAKKNKFYHRACFEDEIELLSTLWLLDMEANDGQ